MSNPKTLEPTPYPSRLTPNLVPQKPINSTDFQTQLNFVKNELFSLENKYDNLMKLFSKSEKKVKDQAEELKKLKQSNDLLSKENNLHKKTIQKINNEKSTLEKTIDENKKYISKVENKLISGVKNQFLLEQNKSLKERIDILEVENRKLIDKEEYINNERKKIEQQAKIIQKAMHLKVEEIKKVLEKEKKENINNEENKDNNNEDIINEEMIYNLGKDKNENEELKKENENLSKENEEIKKKLKNLQEKVQEVNFAKSTLTKMLVEKENIINEMNLKKKEFEENIEKLKDEKKILEKYINDMENKQKEEEEKRMKEEEEKKRIEQEEREKKIKEEEENKKKQEEDILYINNEKNMIKDYKIKIQILEYANKDLTEKLANSDNQIDILEKSLETISQKNKKIEKLYKENISQNTLFLNEVKTLKTECDNQNLAFKKLKISNDKNIAIINELNNKLHEYEKENLKLISKLNKQIFEKDYVENNLVKQNNQILINNKEQEEKIQKLIYENNILNQEKDQYKKLLEQIYNHTNKLIKEKNISIIRQQIKDIKNITNTICTNNNDNNNIYNYDYCIETNNDINSESNFHIIDNSDILNNLKENESKNNGGKLTFDLKGKKMLIENTKDNTNDNRSLTPIHKDNDNSFISTLEENNIGQNKSYLIPNSGKKRDKILEMIRQERNKKKQLGKELQKIEL